MIDSWVNTFEHFKGSSSQGEFVWVILESPCDREVTLAAPMEGPCHLPGVIDAK